MPRNIRNSMAAVCGDPWREMECFIQVLFVESFILSGRGGRYSEAGDGVSTPVHIIKCENGGDIPVSHGCTSHPFQFHI